MEKRTKQILGCAGLASVALITGATYGLPNVNAESSAGATVPITVTVVNDGGGTGGGATGGDGTDENVPAVNISNIKENSTTTASSIDININYQNADFIKYTLTHVDANGKKHVYELDTYQTPTKNGSHAWTLDLGQYGYGSFTLAASVNGEKTSTDTVKFFYNAVDITSTKNVDNSGNPIIHTAFGKSVTRLCYDVYYTGEATKGDGTLVIGGEELCHNLSPAEIASGSIDYTLPFNSTEFKKSIKAGNYRVVVRSYNAAGTLLGIDEGRLSSFMIPNTGGDLEVPDTGANFIASLNLSRADYIISGIVVFVFATILALYLVNRSGRARNYKRR